MVKFYESIPDEVQEWMLKQSVFFTGSAPLAGKHINVSPKGHPESTLAILNPNQVAYLDATGSGAETISHIYENGRVTLMFCSFGAAPRILRLFCRGKVVEKGNKTFNTLVERMIDSGMKMDKEILEAGLSSGDEDEEARPMKMSMKGIRAVIVLHVFKVQTSCGFGVPVFPRSKGDKSEYDTLGAGMVNGLPPNHNISAQSGGPMKLWDDRPTMPAWASKMSAKNALEKYRESNNWRSLDGCPGLTAARKDRGQWLMVEQVRVRTSRMAVGQWDAFIFGILLALFTFSVGWKLGVIELRM